MYYPVWPVQYGVIRLHSLGARMGWKSTKDNVQCSKKINAVWSPINSGNQGQSKCCETFNSGVRYTMQLFL